MGGVLCRKMANATFPVEEGCIYIWGVCQKWSPSIAHDYLPAMQLINARKMPLPDMSQCKYLLVYFTVGSRVVLWDEKQHKWHGAYSSIWRWTISLLDHHTIGLPLLFWRDRETEYHFCWIIPCDPPLVTLPGNCAIPINLAVDGVSGWGGELWSGVDCYLIRRAERLKPTHGEEFY